MRDTTTGRLIWGIGPIAANAARFGHRARMRALAVTQAELEGRIGRVVPGRLLAVPEWALGFGGLEPYTDLSQAARLASLHEDAVLDFGYDWRLSVEHNGPLLAAAASAHLASWRAHPALEEYRRENHDDRVPRLIFVAHSMGGLVVRAALRAEVPGDSGLAPGDIRTVLTLGTPFEGSVDSVELLADGENSLHLPTEAARDASRTMPGVYDLLPWYRCRIVGGEEDVVRLTPDDVAAVGGDLELAKQAFERRAEAGSAGGLPGHRAVVGVAQPTSTSLEIRDGAVLAHRFGFRRDGSDRLLRAGDGRLARHNHGGDGRVYRYAARPAGVAEAPVAQQHQALAKTSSALDVVRAVITGTDELGSVLGQGDVGIDVPQFAVPGQPLPIRLSGQFDVARTRCVITDAVTGVPVLSPVVRGRPDSEDALQIEAALPGPGLFRVEVAAGSDPVTALVFTGAVDDLGQ